MKENFTKKSMIFLPYLYMQMFWGKKVKQGRNMSEMSIESFVQAKESTIDDWAFGSLVKCKLKFLRTSIDLLAYITPVVCQQISFFLQTIIKLYWMLQPCSLTFIVSNVKMDYELNYELMTACNLIIGEIKWNLNFHFFESFENFNQSLLSIYRIIYFMVLTNIQYYIEFSW